MRWDWSSKRVRKAFSDKLCWSVPNKTLVRGQVSKVPLVRSARILADEMNELFVPLLSIQAWKIKAHRANQYLGEKGIFHAIYRYNPFSESHVYDIKQYAWFAFVILQGMASLANTQNANSNSLPLVGNKPDDASKLATVALNSFAPGNCLVQGFS